MVLKRESSPPRPSSPVLCICRRACPIHGPLRPRFTPATGGNTRVGDEVDPLCDAMNYVNINPPQTRPRALTPDEMVADGELKETDEFVIPARLHDQRSGGFHIVITGRSTGVFTNWALANSLTSGFSNNCHYGLPTVEQAWEDWRTACLGGLITNPVHSSSVFPRIVSLADLNARADAANAAAREAAGESTAATGGVPTAGSSNRASQPVASSSGKKRADEPTSGKGWVVIVGRRPGVYSNEHEWRDALSMSSRGWAFPCTTLERAESAFAAMEHLSEVIE
ncbi:hypothetical protein BC629DRAFT_744402 [Irpex lacteus]|nr:hypothetical protein BC629DRAFT_744402 [Irpex lacteus]